MTGGGADDERSESLAERELEVVGMLRVSIRPKFRLLKTHQPRDLFSFVTYDARLDSTLRVTMMQYLARQDLYDVTGRGPALCGHFCVIYDDVSDPTLCPGLSALGARAFTRRVRHLLS